MTTPIPQDVVDAALKVHEYWHQEADYGAPGISGLINECITQSHYNNNIYEKACLLAPVIGCSDRHVTSPENWGKDRLDRAKKACRDLLEALGD